MTTKKTLIQIKLDPEEVEQIDRHVDRINRTPFQPVMYRTTFIREAVQEKLARCESIDRKEAA